MHYICNSIETKILIITYYKYLLINKPKKNQAKMNKKMEKHLMMKIKMQWAETCETWIKMLLQKVFEIATRRLIIVV